MGVLCLTRRKRTLGTHLGYLPVFHEFEESVSSTHQLHPLLHNFPLIIKIREFCGELERTEEERRTHITTALQRTEEERRTHITTALQRTEEERRTHITTALQRTKEERRTHIITAL